MVECILYPKLFRPKEGDFARKHASILKKDLEKKEKMTASTLTTPKRAEASKMSPTAWDKSKEG